MTVNFVLEFKTLVLDSNSEGVPMAFSDYKNIAQVQKQFNIKYQENKFIHAPAYEPPTQFVQELEFYQANIDIYTSEASRCELIISPILREIYKNYYQQYSFWIQKSITYDEMLTGTPDYLFATKSNLGKTVLEFPLVIIVEAKRNDFEQGWGQCLAELVAAQKLNQDTHRPVYGIVTDSEVWKFGQLIEDQFIKNTENYTIDNLPNLFGALNFILESIKTVSK